MISLRPCFFIYCRLSSALVGLLFASFSLVAMPATAQADASPQLREQLQQEYPIILTGSKALSESDLRAIHAAAAAMPAAFFQALDEPLSIEARPQKCLFAQGRYDGACPSFSEDGRTFYLYEPGGESPRLLHRVMPGLDKAQRRALFYQRAIVHALVSKLDQKYRWSASRRWQKLNGWDGDTPMNQDWRGYSRPIGRRSARLDLLTFAEEYFARPESIAPGAVAADQNLACRRMSASRVWTQLIQQIAPDWRAPGPGETVAGTGCPAFEEWFDREHITGMELVFVGARADAVESIYGHIIIRATYDADAKYFRAGDQPIFQFGAVTASQVSSAAYIFKGLFGGFTSVLEYNSWRVADRLFARYEGRSLRRYPMNLSPAQLQQVMQRIWESQRHVNYSYYFFHRNCASLLVDLLEPALELPFAPLPSFIVMPTDVLDTLAHTPNGRGQALIDSDHTEWPSNEARALDAVKQRRTIIDAIGEQHGAAAPDLIAEIRRVHPQIEARAPDTRQKAYARLAAQSAAYFDAHPPNSAQDALTQKLIDYYYLSTIVERYFVESARFARRESMLLASDQRRKFSAQGALDELQDIYKIPGLQERMLARNARAKEQTRLLRPPSAEFSTPKAKQLWAAEQRVQATYDTTLQALSGAIDAYGGAWNGGAYLERVELTKRRDEAAFNHRSIGPSGRFLLGPRLGLQSVDAFDRLGAPRPRLGLSAAFIRDELGEARRRGYSPEMESRIFDLDLELEPGADWAQSIKAQAIIFRYLNLSRKEGPFVEDWTDRFGWGVDVQIRHDGRRGLIVGADASTGYLYPFWMSERGVNHLVLGIFGAVRGDHGQAQSRSMIGGQAFLRAQTHLYGSFANLLQLKLQTRHFIALDNTWQFDASAELNTRHALGSVEHRPIWIEPYLALEYTSRAYQAETQRVSELSAGLRLEFSL